MVPERDSHWPNSSPITSQQGSQPDVIHTGNSHPNKKRSTIIEPLQQQLDETHLVQIATEAFVRELGLEDDSILKDGKVQIREVPAGTYLMKEESHKVTTSLILLYYYPLKCIFSYSCTFLSGCCTCLCRFWFINS